MWSDLLAAIALVLIIEGIMPFLSPTTLRRVVAEVAQLDDRALRFGGLTAMVVGLLLLYVVR